MRFFTGSFLVTLNLIELLMAEHSSLRVHLNYVKAGKDQDLIYDVEAFVTSCHARIEDEIVFPILKDLSGDQENRRSLSRIEADHRLIEKISDEIRNRTVSGETEVLRKRILLFANTLETHNASEETLVFHLWKSVGKEQEEEAMSKAKKIMHDFGLDRYFRITGISDRMLGLVE